MRKHLSWLVLRLVCVCVFVCVLVARSCPTLCDPMNSSLPGSSVDEILQARILSGLPFPSLADLPNPGIELGSPALQADSLPSEPPGNPFLKFPEAKPLIESLKTHHIKLITNI